VAELNETIHQSARLRIMSVLVTLDAGDRMDFRSLTEMLELTDGNLGAHLVKLEEARYVRVDKEFVERKPRTFLSVTSKGRAAFEDHVAALQAIVRTARRK
jgi:DNA-binding MarR family transcriptional regulator